MSPELPSMTPGGGSPGLLDSVKTPHEASHRPSRRRLKFIAAAVVLAFGLIEGLCYLCGRIFESPFIYRPPRAKYEDYRAAFDPLLGWAGFNPRSGQWDETTSRRTPAFPDPKASPPIISLYGDSWTFSLGVDDEHALGNALSKRVGRRVSNFGGVAYGTDQAYLRFRQNTTDPAKIVVLGHFSDDATRNVNRYPYLRMSDIATAFKPRFVLTDTGGLRLVPPPDLTPQEFRDCLQSPETYLKDDYFVPGGHSGLGRFRFPYCVSLLGVLNHYYVRAVLRGEPYWAEFYRPDHPSKALAVSVGIIRAFVHDAREMGKLPIIAIYPHPFDLAYKKTHGRWTYQPLLDELDAAKIPYFEAGAFLLQALGGRDPATLYAPFAPDRVARHPNEEGCALHAEGLFRHIQERMGGQIR
jgi:hypothetical protein